MSVHTCTLKTNVSFFENVHIEMNSNDLRHHLCIKMNSINVKSAISQNIDISQSESTTVV